jgi:hypothetical protein
VFKSKGRWCTVRRGKKMEATRACLLHIEEVRRERVVYKMCAEIIEGITRMSA